MTILGFCERKDSVHVYSMFISVYECMCVSVSMSVCVCVCMAVLIIRVLDHLGSHSFPSVCGFTLAGAEWY